MTNGGRVSWVDYAKGVCIILVVMMHVVQGYQRAVGAEGWMQPILDFAQPFRMPDFFLISGLFLSRTINGPVRSYIDRKLVHFAYFYILWLTIQHTILKVEILLDAPGAFAWMWLAALVEPTSTLWFVHMLAIFYVVTWLLRGAPKWLLVAGAAGLETVHQLGLFDPGWQVAERFAERYVYFVIGYVAAPAVFAIADRLGRRIRLTAIVLPLWGVANWFLAQADAHYIPLVSLAMGLAGALAVCAVASALAAHSRLNLLGYVGRNSIVVYLTFFFPMRVMEKTLLALGAPAGSIGLACLLILIVAVASPLMFHRVIRGGPLAFLYERPRALRLERPRPAPASPEAGDVDAPRRAA